MSKYNEPQGIVTLLKGIPEEVSTSKESGEATNSQQPSPGNSRTSSPSKDRGTSRKQEKTSKPLEVTISAIPSFIASVSHQAKAQLYPFAIRVQSFWKRYLQHCLSLTDTLLRAQYIDNTKVFGGKLSKRMLRQTTEAVDSAKTVVSTLVKGNKKDDN